MTAAELVALWSERDRRYRLRRMMHAPWPLVGAEAELVRGLRQREINLLPPPERAAAWRAWVGWRPPGSAW